MSRSDLNLTPPTTRSGGHYRLYDAEAVARLDLVRTLRELGLGLDTVRKVLDRQTTVADVAKAHVRALDAEIRTLQVRRAVLRSIAQRGSTTEEMILMHKLAQLSAQERQRLIDDFVDRTFDGIEPDTPGAHIAAAMRQLPAEPAQRRPSRPSARQEIASDTKLRTARSSSARAVTSTARLSEETGPVRCRAALPPIDLKSRGRNAQVVQRAGQELPDHASTPAYRRQRHDAVLPQWLCYRAGHPQSSRGHHPARGSTPVVAHSRTAEYARGRNNTPDQLTPCG